MNIPIASQLTKRYRIGIDVGGTFTHAVAMDAETLTLAGKVKVPTSHHHVSGVGQGVVNSLKDLMAQLSIDASQIVFVAHSTTQATNSLLEGDVEKVAILSVGSGWKGRAAKRAANLKDIPLAPGRSLHTVSHAIDPTDASHTAKLDAFLDKIRLQAIRVVVVTSPFSVDDPEDEIAVSEYVRSKGFFCTATHEVSKLYGIRVRTRTTAINASILPKMMEVADHTEREIRNLGIQAPFMIMRSDGGVMNVEEMRKKPVLTLLSGPAAGIAAALRYLKISDGIFLEVGGTSTDISVIRNGRAITRSATIGGNKTFLKTLDCRTLGVGGGSIPRVNGRKVLEVGPRSAHIAGVRYAAFDSILLTGTAPSSLKPQSVQPKPGDPKDYLVFESQASDGKPMLRFGLTPTCAANALSLVPAGDCAEALPGFLEPWGALLEASSLGTLKEFANRLLQVCSDKVGPTVEKLLKEYQMEKSWVKLVGGGGGAAAIVPHLASHLGMQYEIAENNDVISAIGVALGLIREVVEKSCVDAKAEDIYRIRAEARDKVISQGADPTSVEVFVEVDRKKNLIRAEAQGAIEFGSQADARPVKNADQEITLSELVQAGQKSLGLAQAPEVISHFASSHLTALLFGVIRKKWFGIGAQALPTAVVLDRRGVARLKLADASLLLSAAGRAVSDLQNNLEAHTLYGDGGTTYPYIYVLLGDRIVDLSKLSTPEHFIGVLEMEMREVPPADPVVLIFSHHAQEG